MPKDTPVEQYKDVLIVRLSAIGDVVMSSAILAGLSKAMPNARFHWLTEDMGGEVLAGNTTLTNLLVLPRRRWRKLAKERHYLTLIKEVVAMRGKIRALNADLVIDAQGLLRSAFWATASGAKWRIGLRSHEGAQFLMSEVVKVDSNPTGRMCNEYRCLLEYLGLDGQDFSMSLAPTTSAREKAKQLLQEAGKDQDAQGKPIFIFPFTTRDQKHWFDERWSELTGRIVSETGRSVWILGGPSDTERAEKIAQASNAPKGKVHVIAGHESNLEEKMSLIEHAGACIGVDTGLSHMSLGLNRPTIVMFGSTCGYTETSPLPGIILYKQMPCSPCRRHPTCDRDFTCMKKISVNEVFDTLQTLLQKHAQ